MKWLLLQNYVENDHAFKLVFKYEISSIKILKDPSLAFGEAYINVTIDFKGNLEQIVETVYEIKTPLKYIE
ncbi:hypothetical protein [Clostridium magnum]|uniref:DUF7884 domain-containing protein n=1 Tax=Clostridium magnum DSM 2767 TaxID=1121326 RepID=A0A161X0H5_9CLOT|nr:hypothetical protein [Clostridium magnum]KZL92928.1 hypothetical protein CLMAG_27420 [Clostridium magnum DSM 2767]SHJ16650.1 cyclopropane-fatty-acyl-phospholipid synthase [Clostridium magnum DSM 2767]